MPERADIAELRFMKKLSALPFVEAIYLYGSRARGDDDEWSDIDLAVLCPRATPEEWQAVRDIVDHAPVLTKIECVRYDALRDSLFKRQIDQYKQVLYAKH